MNDYFENNEMILKERFPHIAQKLLSPAKNLRSGNIARSKIVKSRKGSDIISVTSQKGEKINLSSVYDPEKEAESVSEKIFEQSNDGIIVILGAGSGYILNELANKAEEGRTVIWIEYSAEILRKILSIHNLAKVLKNDFFHLILSDNPSEAVNAIMSVRMRNGFKDIEVISNPSLKKFNKNFYEKIETSLAQIKKSPIKKIIDYKKFSHEKLRILVFNSSYFTVRECIKAFRNLGNIVRVLNFKEKKDFISGLVNEILDFKPDFIFTVNHLGFDEDGKLSSLLTSMNIPFAVWYVDSPFYALKENNTNTSEFCKIFMWDKTYISSMQRRGFDKISYLPLAADTETFKPVRFSQNYAKYKSSASFVGNSMFGAVNKWEKKIKNISLIKSFEEEIIEKQLQDHTLPIEKILIVKLQDIMPDLKPETTQFIDICAYITWKTTMRYRHNVVKAVIDSGGIVYGDDDWTKVIDNSHIRKSVDYYSHLPLVYNFTDINLNCTSFQMNSTVNQRVFDCAASNAFLITDNQPDLFELFKEDEFVSYEKPEEIKSMINFYLNNEKERRKISFKAYNRVINQHTYEIRMTNLISEMKKDFGRKVSFSFGNNKTNGGQKHVCITNL